MLSEGHNFTTENTDKGRFKSGGNNKPSFSIFNIIFTEKK